MEIKDFLKSKLTEGLSPVITGRVKMSVEDVIARWPQGFHVSGLDIINSDQYGTLVPIIIAEDESCYSYAPGMLKKILTELVDKVSQGDIENTNLALQEIGGIPVKYERKISKKTGNEYTLVTLLLEQ